MRETWYKLEDGSLADPADVIVNDDGRIAHAETGVAVAEKSPGVPWTWNVDPDEERARDLSSPVTVDMDTAKPKRSYTRRAKAD